MIYKAISVHNRANEQVFLVVSNDIEYEEAKTITNKTFEMYLNNKSNIYC